MPRFSAVRDAVRSNSNNLLDKQNVVGVGVGKDENGEYCMKVFVTEKMPVNMLSASSLVPKVVSGIPTQVVEIGRPAIEAVNYQQLRPVAGGFSIAHHDSTAGTLGCVVYDNETGRRVVLSNNHVIANSNLAKIGSDILQPGPADGGQLRRDAIAWLYRFVLIKFPRAGLWLRILKMLGREIRREVNLVDAALAMPTDDALLDSSIKDIGHISDIAFAEVGDKVCKSGRTTGYTEGEVLANYATVAVNFGSQGTATFENQIILSNMSEPGDSGSLIVRKDGDKNIAVGLLFAGSSEVTIANNIYDVVAELDISF